MQIAVRSRSSFEATAAPALMGVLNVTPDSFSDGGAYEHPHNALTQAKLLMQHGAGILDVGAESTRPGATPLTPLEEQRRVLPVLESLATLNPKPLLSIDTRHAETARLALGFGVSIINDISGHPSDALIKEVVDAQATYVLMHNAQTFAGMHQAHHYSDTVKTVCDHLQMGIEHLRQKGLAEKQIWVDPGLGFAKNAAQNWELTRRLDAVVALGAPVLVGASRKRFVTEALEHTAGAPSLAARDKATAALCALAISQGVSVVRVHNVEACREALVMARLWRDRPD